MFGLYLPLFSNYFVRKAEIRKDSPQKSGAEKNEGLSENTPTPQDQQANISDPPYSSQYLELLSMIPRGIVPPGVKTDVDDKVRDPSAPLVPGTLSKPRKPYQADGEIASSGISVDDLIDDFVPKELGGPLTPTDSDKE